MELDELIEHVHGAERRQKRQRNSTQSRPYPCDEPGCPKAFARRSDLIRHQRIHSNERPWACTWPGCRRDFIQRSALKVHYRVHTGERPHACMYEDCNKRFSDSSSLARHRRVHTGLRPYKCPYEGCPKDFCRKTTLTKHVKNVHFLGGNASPPPTIDDYEQPYFDEHALSPLTSAPATPRSDNADVDGEGEDDDRETPAEDPDDDEWKPEHLSRTQRRKRMPMSAAAFSAAAAARRRQAVASAATRAKSPPPLPRLPTLSPEPLWAAPAPAQAPAAVTERPVRKAAERSKIRLSELDARDEEFRRREQAQLRAEDELLRRARHHLAEQYDAKQEEVVHEDHGYATPPPQHPPHMHAWAYEAVEHRYQHEYVDERSLMPPPEHPRSVSRSPHTSYAPASVAYHDHPESHAASPAHRYLPTPVSPEYVSPDANSRRLGTGWCAIPQQYYEHAEFSPAATVYVHEAPVYEYDAAPEVIYYHHTAPLPSYSPLPGRLRRSSSWTTPNFASSPALEAGRPSGLTPGAASAGLGITLSDSVPSHRRRLSTISHGGEGHESEDNDSMSPALTHASAIPRNMMAAYGSFDRLASIEDEHHEQSGRRDAGQNLFIWAGGRDSI